MSLISRSRFAAAIVALLMGLSASAHALPILTQDLPDPNLAATLSFLGEYHSDDLAALNSERAVWSQWTHALAWPERASRGASSDNSSAGSDQVLIDQPPFPTLRVPHSFSVTVPERGTTVALLAWAIGALLLLRSKTGLLIAPLWRSET